MTTKVKIIDEVNEITRVREISGAGRDEDKFIDRTDLGRPGEVIAVPEFWIEDGCSEAARQYDPAAFVA